MSPIVHLMLAIERAREAGYPVLTEAMQAMLVKMIAEEKAVNGGVA
jgi:hypothetical protein